MGCVILPRRRRRSFLARCVRFSMVWWVVAFYLSPILSLPLAPCDSLSPSGYRPSFSARAALSPSVHSRSSVIVAPRRTRAFKARYISTVSLSFAIYTTINIDIRNYDDVGYMSFSFAYCIYISVLVLFAQYIYIKKML